MTEHNVTRRITWGPVEATLGGILLFFGSQILVAILFTVILSLIGWNEQRIESWFSSGNVAQFIVSATVSFVTISLLFSYLSFKKTHPSDIGLVRPRARDIGYTLLGAGTYVASYIILVGVLSKVIPTLDTNQAQDLGFQAGSMSNDLVLIFISLVVLPPIVEEIVVRGFIFTGLRSRLSFWVSAIISSSLFGVAHLLGGEGGSTIWIAVVDTFILGMVLAYLREKTGSLWSPIGLHALKNFIAFMALFVFKVA